MKKKIIVFIFSLFIIENIVNAFSKNYSRVTETGYVRCWSNEPFTVLVFVTDDGSYYRIESKTLSKEKLLELQGKHLKLKGELIPLQPMDSDLFELIIINEYKVIK